MVPAGERARSASGLARRVSSRLSVAVPCCGGGSQGCRVLGAVVVSGMSVLVGVMLVFSGDRGGKPQRGNEEAQGWNGRRAGVWRTPGARGRTQICPRQWKGVTVGKRQKCKATAAQDSFPRATAACLSHQHRPTSRPASLLEQDIARWLLGRLAQLLSSRPDTAVL